MQQSTDYITWTSKTSRPRQYNYVQSWKLHKYIFFVNRNAQVTLTASVIVLKYIGVQPLLLVCFKMLVCSCMCQGASFCFSVFLCSSVFGCKHTLENQPEFVCQSVQDVSRISLCLGYQPVTVRVLVCPKVLVHARKQNQRIIWEKVKTSQSFIHPYNIKACS